MNKQSTFYLLLFFLVSQGICGQLILSGIVKDSENGETLIGVNVTLDGTMSGTVTELDGRFRISSNQVPATLRFSLVGFATQSITLDQSNESVEIVMQPQPFISDEIIVSASRVAERIMESPVTVERLDLGQLKNTASVDFYDEINNVKGVSTVQASLTFNSINTRGYGSGGNTRFVQLMDGMDNAAPLLNFPTGNVVGISELDIKSMDLLPGSASALYGPNAFNGLLMMESKSPFDFRGLSAQIKTGVTDGYVQGDKIHPVIGAALRYADVINDKFAYKFNVSYFKANDWEAINYTEHRRSSILSPLKSSTVAGFDGMNLYGDETNLGSVTGNPSFDVTRTGFKEELLLKNNDAKSIKFDGSLHYRINDNLETNISYRHGTGNSIYQGSERYALRGFIQRFAKWELNSNKWNIRTYVSMTDAGDSYNMSALGAFTNEAIWATSKSTKVDLNAVLAAQNIPFNLGPAGILTLPGGWGLAANLAANPNIAKALGLNGSLEAAKAFADGGGFSALPAAVKAQLAPSLGFTLFKPQFDLLIASLPQTVQLAIASNPALVQQLYGYLGGEILKNASGTGRPAEGSEELNTIINNIRNTPFQSGGALLKDNSKMYHSEGNYDLSSLFGDKISAQIGANYRKYSLFSSGTIFNEDTDNDGVNKRINFDEYGAYLQLAKTIGGLKLQGSLRYDKSQNFKGQFTPRISTVYSFGDNKENNIRASFQTGFKNPSSQAQYIFFPTTLVLLGGVKENAQLKDQETGEIFDIFQQSGIDYVKPEKLVAFELGYKTLINKNLFLDINFYHNEYKDFISQIIIPSTKSLKYKNITFPVGQLWYPYTNAPFKIKSNGIELGSRYSLSNNWSVSVNYAWAKESFDKKQLTLPQNAAYKNFSTSFNTPEHRLGFGIENRKLIKNVGFGMNYRWQDEFLYNSSFGEGYVSSYGTLDMQMSYRIPNMKTIAKLGITNLLKNKYSTNIGNPYIGRMVSLSFTYDQQSR